jgi:hypothetical protein
VRIGLAFAAGGVIGLVGECSCCLTGWFLIWQLFFFSASHTDIWSVTNGPIYLDTPDPFLWCTCPIFFSISISWQSYACMMTDYDVHRLRILWHHDSTFFETTEDLASVILYCVAEKTMDLCWLFHPSAAWM